MTRDEAGRHLRSLMEAMYEGRSVRTPAEFRDDLRALRIAADVLDPQPGADRDHDNINDVLDSVDVW